MFIPLWILIPLALLAALALAERILLPGVRVVLRRRVRKLVDDLNAHLKLRLQPFKLTRKRIVEEMLIHDPEVAAEASEYRAAHNLSWDGVMDLVRVYAREIVPRFNVYLYFRPSHWFARHLARFCYRVRVRFLDTRAVAGINTGASVVFIMNHRSNFDYLLVSYLVGRLTAVSYAVGEWARVWPLDTLLRRMGAYFVRRKASDPLYRKVLERYVQLSTASGVTQGIFPEGRLTRDGRLQPPRLGLLNYLLKRLDPDGPHDLVFIPVGLNYDRVFEDRSHALQVAGEPGAATGLGAVAVAARFLAKTAWLVLRGRLERFGYACVSFGIPFSVTRYIGELGRDFRRMSEEEYRAEVGRLGEHLMAEIARAVPVTPVPFVATALARCGGDDVPLEELANVAAACLAELVAAAAPIALPRSDARTLLDLGLRQLALRRVVRVEASVVHVEPADHVLLQYYANSIAHFLEKSAGQASTTEQPTSSGDSGSSS